jgi:hypothetical protein
LIFILMQTATVNTVLSTLANLVAAPGMAGAIWPVAVNDKNGTSLFTGANAWVRKHPERTFGRAAGTVEWEIRVAHLKRIDGGN